MENGSSSLLAGNKSSLFELIRKIEMIKNGKFLTSILIKILSKFNFSQNLKRNKEKRVQFEQNSFVCKKHTKNLQLKIVFWLISRIFLFSREKFVCKIFKFWKYLFEVLGKIRKHFLCFFGEKNDRLFHRNDFDSFHSLFFFFSVSFQFNYLEKLYLFVENFSFSNLEQAWDQFLAK